MVYLVYGLKMDANSVWGIFVQKLVTGLKYEKEKCYGTCSVWNKSS